MTGIETVYHEIHMAPRQLMDSRAEWMDVAYQVRKRHDELLTTLHRLASLHDFTTDNDPIVATSANIDMGKIIAEAIAKAK